MKNWRINIVFTFIVLFGAAIIGRLIYLQIFQYDYYMALAQGQNSQINVSDEVRGTIYFSGGQTLASSVRDNEGNFIRKYPQGEMASQVVGFLGGEGAGQYGLEGFYNEVLRPKEVIQTQYFFSFNYGAGAGQDIYLTLDFNIQYEAEQLLARAKKDFDIKSGSIVVLEPSTGKILAMAILPGFDPNKYSQVKDFSIFQNPIIQSFYEPGSVLKAVTMASALDQGKVTPQTTYVDTGILKIGGSTIYNYNKHIWGQKTMTEVLENSINTGAVFAERKVGNDVFMEYLRRFGLFEPTRVDLQGEVYSENKELKKGREISYVTASFGQGIEITPLQMARAFAVIANGGKLVKPYIVEKIVDGGKTAETKPEISKSNVILPKTASDLTEMLISVVRNGFAQTAKVKGYDVAGKTGTSQVPYTAIGISKKGYSDQTWQSFVGFAPAFSPRFLILVKLDNPKADTSEYSAAPIFGKLAEYIINYMEIPPDHE